MADEKMDETPAATNATTNTNEEKSPEDLMQKGPAAKDAPEEEELVRAAWSAILTNALNAHISPTNQQ